MVPPTLDHRGAETQDAGQQIGFDYNRKRGLSRQMHPLNRLPSSLPSPLPSPPLHSRTSASVVSPSRPHRRDASQYVWARPPFVAGLFRISLPLAVSYYFFFSRDADFENDTQQSDIRHQRHRDHFPLFTIK